MTLAKRLLFCSMTAIAVVMGCFTPFETGGDPVGSAQEPVSCGDNLSCAPNGAQCLDQSTGSKFICVSGQFDPLPEICAAGESCAVFQKTCTDACGQTLTCDAAGFFVPNASDPYCIPDAGVGGAAATTSSGTTTSGTGGTGGAATTTSSTSTTTSGTGGTGGAATTTSSTTSATGGTGGVGGATTTTSSTSTSTTTTTTTTTSTVDPNICTAGNVCHPEEVFCTDVLNWPQFIRCCGGILVNSSTATPCPTIDAGTDAATGGAGGAATTSTSTSTSNTNTTTTSSSTTTSGTGGIGGATTTSSTTTTSTTTATGGTGGIGGATTTTTTTTTTTGTGGVDAGTDAASDASISDSGSDAAADSGSDASACSSAGNAGSGNVRIRWIPPTGYIQNGAVIATGEYNLAGAITDHWNKNTNPICTLVADGVCGYHCYTNIPANSSVIFNIFHTDSSCPVNGGGWMFDQYTWNCGSCVGLANCCGKDYGTIIIEVNGVNRTFNLMDNGVDALPCTYNGATYI